MPVQLGKKTVTLSGVVAIEEVESLAAWLRETPNPKVNLRGCTRLHTAALQALLAAGAVVSVAPKNQFLRSWILPLIETFGHANSQPSQPVPGSTEGAP